MKRRAGNGSIWRITGITVLGIAASIWLGSLAGLRINGTRSLPLGMYWAVKRPIQKGELVFVLPPARPEFELAVDRGYLGRGYSAAHSGALIKRVAATAGDRVSVDAQGVSVNGRRLANTQPFERDGAGRPLHPWYVTNYELGASEVLLLSDFSRWSWDARYFGPLPVSAIESVIRPILTWN